MLQILLESYRTIFSAVCLIGIVLFASPTIALLIQPPAGEPFSQIYLLGPNKMMEDIPYKIKTNEQYLVYVGVGNQMNSSNYYTCKLKLGTASDAFPNYGVPSSLPTIFEYKQFIAKEQNWESPLTFSVDGLTVTGSTLMLSNITINGYQYTLNKEVQWDQARNGYFVNLFVELWIFNSISGQNRFVDSYVSLTLKLNP